jgi:putative transposase
MTPAMVHHGQATHILAHRQVVLDAADAAHPERFVRKPPKPGLTLPGLDQPPA